MPRLTFRRTGAIYSPVRDMFGNQYFESTVRILLGPSYDGLEDLPFLVNGGPEALDPLTGFQLHRHETHSVSERFNVKL